MCLVGVGTIMRRRQTSTRSKTVKRKEESCFKKNYEMPSEAPPTRRSLAEQEISSSSLFSENALLAFLLRGFLLYCVTAAH